MNSLSVASQQELSKKFTPDRKLNSYGVFNHGFLFKAKASDKMLLIQELPDKQLIIDLWNTNKLTAPQKVIDRYNSYSIRFYTNDANAYFIIKSVEP